MATALLLRRQSSSACPSCNKPLDLGGYPLGEPPIAASIAFAALNILALFALFVTSCFVRRFAILNSYQTTRFGLIWALVFTLVNVIFDLATNVVESTATGLTYSYLIIYPFYSFFAVAADLTLIYTLFGFLYALAVLRGDARAARGWRIAGIVMISVLCVIEAVWFAIYCVRSARDISGYISTPGFRYYTALAVTRGIKLAFDSIRFVLACIFLGFGIHAVVRYRHSSNFSRIPLVLVATTWPFYVFHTLSSVAIDAAYNYGSGHPDYYDLPIITEITRFTFLAVVFGGLVASGMRPEWSQAPAAGAMQSGYRDPAAGPYNPGFDPTHFTLHGHQNQTGMAQSTQPSTYGGGAPSTMSGTTAHGAGQYHKTELPLNAAPYPELPNQHHHHNAPGGRYDPYYRGPQQRTSELPAGYRPVAGSPPPQSELPGALRAGSPPAPAELHSPRRF